MAILEDGFDPSLNIVQALKEDALPEHDKLYLDAKEKVEDAENTPDEEDAALDVGEGDGAVDGTMDEEASASGDDDDDNSEFGDIDGTQTTPATESIRREDSLVLAFEDYGEQSTMGKIGSYAGAAAVGVGKFSWNVLSEVAGYLKEAGIQYGPGILQRLKATVGLVAGRSLRLALKLATVSSLAYRRKKNSIEKTRKRLIRLKETVVQLKETNTELSATEPFEDRELFDLFFINGKAGNIKDSVKVMAGLLGCLKTDIDGGLEHDIRVIEQLIDNTRRGVRFNPVAYMKHPQLTNSYAKRDISGFSNNPELIESYVHHDTLPNNILLIMGLPKDSVVEEALKTGDTTDIVRSYHAAFIVLGANPARPRAIPMVNYVDKDTLLYLLEMCVGICDAALTHVELFKSNVKRAERLRMGYQQYFAWLTASEEQKSLKDSLAELIYLKQSFATKVYLPAMLDIHDYVAVWLKQMAKFAETNVKAFRPVAEDE
jgi:hypothetical protein